MESADLLGAKVGHLLNVPHGFGIKIKMQIVPIAKT